MIAIWRNECFGGFRLKVNIGRTSHKKSLCQHYFQFWTIWTLLINVMATQHSVYPEPQCLIPCRQQRQAICELKAYWMLQKKTNKNYNDKILKQQGKLVTIHVWAVLETACVVTPFLCFPQSRSFSKENNKFFTSHSGTFYTRHPSKNRDETL